MNRTWMKVSNSAYAFWVAIEYDVIVSTQPPGMMLGHHRDMRGMRADDTLSQLTHNGWTIEGPFDEPV